MERMTYVSIVGDMISLVVQGRCVMRDISVNRMGFVTGVEPAYPVREILVMKATTMIKLRTGATDSEL